MGRPIRRAAALAGLCTALAACDAAQPATPAAGMPQIVGCSTVKFEGNLWDSSGCARGVPSYDAVVRTTPPGAPAREASFHIECTDGCIAKASATPSVPATAASGTPSTPMPACAWQPNAGTVTAALTGNNAAEITSPAPGGSPGDPALRKMVPVNITAPIAGLEVGPAWLLRSSGTDESAYLAIPVRNTGAAPYACGIRMENYHWRTAMGAEAADPTDPPRATNVLTGSVGTTSGITTDSCLGPGETGYIADIRLAPAQGTLYSDVAAIEFTFSPSFPAVPAPGKLLPTRYQLGACGRSSGIRFQFDNVGSDPIRVPEIVGGWVLYLDAAGIPEAWHFLGLEDWNVVAPGASLLLPESFFSPPPPGWKAQVYGQFDDVQPTAPADPSLLRLFDEIAASRRHLRANWARAGIHTRQQHE